MTAPPGRAPPASDAPAAPAAPDVPRATLRAAGGALLGACAHELGNALTVLSGRLYLLGRRLPAEDRASIDACTPALERVAALAEALQVLGEGLPPGRELLDLGTMTRRVLGWLAATGVTKRCAVTTEIADRPLLVEGEPGALAALLVSLVLAAVEAGARAGALRVSVQPMPHGGAAIVIAGDGVLPVDGRPAATAHGLAAALGAELSVASPAEQHETGRPAPGAAWRILFSHLRPAGASGRDQSCPDAPLRIPQPPTPTPDS